VRGVERFPMKDQTWKTDAACRGMDPDVFFPTDEVGQAAALDVCAECPVRELCLEFAIRSRQTDGVWGGTTPRERRKLIRQRRTAIAA
jgi:WhiB family transcriptional regulator, redox-sensing transcriptional regulator